jgi:1-acyl-sn-glycerol-3-phosphate acyltransferase
MVLKNLPYVPAAWIKLCKYAKHTDDYPEIEKWNHIRYILTRAVKSGNIDLKVTGLENIPRDRSFLLYSNHQGMFDVLAIAATCEPPLGTVLKKELKDVPLLKQIVACTKSFAMDREDVRQSLTVIQGVIKEINAGRNYLIFPEGTRSKKSNDLLEFHNGSFRCALKTKCTVVPIALVDCYKVLDQKGSKPVTVQIHYLKPIEYEEYKDLNTKELAALVRSRIEEKVKASV